MVEGSLPPFIRWAGSKRKLLPKLTPYWQNGSFIRYIEPFMGSAALFFKLNPNRALLTDMNQELVDTFVCVRDHPRAVFNRYSTMTVGKSHYYALREIDPYELPILDRAARFIYLNRFCFNGIYRTNMSGKFNVPFSASGTGGLPNWNALKETSVALKKTDIRCMDFRRALNRKLGKSDFIYMDPPYAVGNRRIFKQYGPETFGLRDLEEIGDFCTSIDKQGAKFLVSYAMCSEALSVFSNWNIERTFTQRNISGFAKNRRKASELLISN